MSPRRTMTPERVAEARRHAAAGLSMTAAAAAMGIDFNALVYWAHRNGSPFADGRDRVDAQRLATIRAWAAEGVSLKEAARRLGLARSSLYQWAARRGLRFPRDAAFRTSPAFVAAARRNQAKAAAVAAEVNRLPVEGIEKRRYINHRDKARKCGVTVTRDDALRAIGRPDLVGAA